MTKIKGFAQKHKKLIAFLFVFLVAGSVTLILLSANISAQVEALPPTTTLLRADLTQTVKANGTVQSANSKKVTSTLAYKITEVLVKVGDTVKKGQPLVTLDLSGLDKNITDTQKSLSTARAQDNLQIQQAQRKVDEAAATRDFNLANNEAAVTAAANTLNSANNALATANDALNAANGRVSAAESNVKTYEQALRQAKTDRDSWTPPEDNPSAVNPNIAIVEAAEKKLTGAKEELAAAQQALPAAQQKQASAASEVDAAQNACNNAVTARDTEYRNDSLAIENARDGLSTAKLNSSAQTHQIQLDSYLKEKEEAVITAPISGTVTAVSAQVGNTPGGAGGDSSGALFTIEDTQKLEIPAYVPEYDAVQLRVGMQAEAATDALSGETWKGTIQSISPTAADANGNFLVTVSITSPAGELAGGMSAKLNIVVESTPSVYAVPYDAVVTDDTGTQVVHVLLKAESGTSENTTPAQKTIPVETGMETDYYIEIIADELVDGMQVVNDPEGKNTSATAAGTGSLFG